MERLDQLYVYIMFLAVCFGIPSAQANGSKDDYEEAYENVDTEASGPTFDVKMVNVTAIQGQTVILPCRVANLGNHVVTWKRMDETLSEAGRLHANPLRYSMVARDNEWNLQIRYIKSSDSGNYYCSVNTPIVKFKTISLHVQVPPDIPDNDLNGNITVKEGETVCFVCNASGIPQPEVSWYRLTSTKPPIKRTSIPGSGEMIIFGNVTRDCEGFYECRAQNGVDPATKKTMYLSVQYGAYVKLLNDRTGQYPGLKVMLVCDIFANPQMEYVWKFKGHKLLSNTTKYKVDQERFGLHQVRLSLTIYRVGFGDYGRYRCEAGNHMGRDSRYAVLYRSDIRLPDHSPHTLPVRNASVTLSTLTTPSTHSSSMEPYDIYTEPAPELVKQGGATIAVGSGLLCAVVTVMSVLLTWPR